MRAAVAQRLLPACIWWRDGWVSLARAARSPRS